MAGLVISSMVMNKITYVKIWDEMIYSYITKWNWSFGPDDAIKWDWKNQTHNEAKLFDQSHCIGVKWV